MRVLWRLLWVCWFSVCACAATGSRPNVILITLDTTRADRMGFLESDRGLTPSLDVLARHSVVFSRAYSSAAYSSLARRHPDCDLPTVQSPPLHGGAADQRSPLLTRNLAPPWLSHGCVCRIDDAGSQKRHCHRVRSRLRHLRCRLPSTR